LLTVALALTMLAGCAAPSSSEQGGEPVGENASERTSAVFTRDVRVCFQNDSSETLIFDYTVSIASWSSPAEPGGKACVVGSEDFGNDIVGAMSARGDSSTAYEITVRNIAIDRPYAQVGCLGGLMSQGSSFTSDNGQFKLTLVREPDNYQYQELRFRVTVADSPEPRTPRATMCDDKGNYSWG